MWTLGLFQDSIQRANSRFTLALLLMAFFVFFCHHSDQFGMQSRLITRFCYNSPNLSTINSQCVLCNYYMFDATLLGCTGSTALNVNITASQAFCVISQCLGQVRQSPIFLGRRRRALPEVDEEDRVALEVPEESPCSAQHNKQSNCTDRYIIAKQVDAEVLYEVD